MKAMKKLKNGKSGWIDGITAEIMKADMETSGKYLEKLFTAVWNQEVVPSEWSKGLIVKIPKKGGRSVCDNYRGITLLSVPSKVFSRVLILRIQDGVESQLREEQAGFRKGRSTTEQLFTLRNISSVQNGTRHCLWTMLTSRRRLILSTERTFGTS